MTTIFTNYYKVLQVDSEAETDVIEAAYRRLALKYHPDINKSPGAEEKMKLINQAKSILTNPKERQMFDQQLGQNTEKKQSQSKRAKKKQETQETVDDADDIWDENSIRNLAVQILIIIQQSLNQKKWRIAREKLYAFEGLGIPSKGNRILPTFTRQFPEWPKAKQLDDIANQQLKKFRINLAIWSSIIYCLALSFLGLVTLGIGAGTNTNDVLLGILAGIGGGFAGLVIGFIVAMLGTWIYSTWFAGKRGEGMDMVLGISTPVIIALAITFGIYIIMGYLIVVGLGYALTGGSKK